MHLVVLAKMPITATGLSRETWMSIIIGAVLSFSIAYLIYRIQKRESRRDKQEHNSRLDELKTLHLQDSEKIKVLYELITKSQKGNLSGLETAVLEQKIEMAAGKITAHDSEQAQALKAIADKHKDEADELLDKIARQEHDLVEMYNLRALNEYRNGYYSNAVAWYRKILELQPDNFDALISVLSSLNHTDMKSEARKLGLRALNTEGKSILNGAQQYDLLNKIILSFDYNTETDQVEPYLLRAIELVRQEFGEKDARMCFIFNELGYLYIAKKDNSKSEEYFLKALTLAEEDNENNSHYLTASLCNLALLYNNLGRYQEALLLIERAYKLQVAVLGEEHPDLIFTKNIEARLYHDLGRYPEAENCYLKAQSVIVKTLGKEHSSYFHLMYDLASLYIRMQRYPEAESIIRELLEQQNSCKGEASYNVARLYSQLSIVLSNQDKSEEAEQQIRKAIDIYQKVAAPDDNGYLAARQSLVKLNLRKGNYKEAEHALLEIIAAYKTQNMEGTMTMAITQGNLAKVYEKQAFWAEAEQHLRLTIEFFTEKAPENPHYEEYLVTYSDILSKLGRLAEAETYKAKAEWLKTRLES
jgi:tetratricopeptide (TPR) repeat protein